jgi:hypothetical protein
MRARCIAHGVAGLTSFVVQRGGTPTARLKTGAEKFNSWPYPRRAEFFALPVAVPVPSRKVGRIAGGKRFFECFVYFFFQVAIQFFAVFLVRSIRAHGLSSSNPHLFRLQSVCFSPMRPDLKLIVPTKRNGLLRGCQRGLPSQLERPAHA